eukprot:CAMPEP_0113491348 /NCGR_PEP_ID=MMETSP0014_2-20120614/27510_1 /TAXON_ID=2857 /ORGANISM="Nitzschia sp." /LENGTH=1390 /DNA_ID=CAMNT_0000385137 /DNA_START=55 /DNA_END=4227 /DNA_ORIENTATION=- /assembly_acc=CAM_ASM_000159
MPDEVSTFPIPASIQDLERDPYNLLPYPHDFEDGDEAARADSFARLVGLIETGNRTLSSGGLFLFDPRQRSEGEDPWMDEDRVQALYTLVRKSMSLSNATRWDLVQSLCRSVKLLSTILDDDQEVTHFEENDEEGGGEEGETQTMPQAVVSQEFRDAFACHLYMLFSFMFFMESESKMGGGGQGGTATTTGRKKKTSDSNTSDGDDTVQLRASCADAMLSAAQSMAKNRFKLWKRGVVEETVVVLPCRIAYQMLESATGVIARKAAAGDAALAMIAATVDSSENLMGTVLAALMDMMHSFEHMAPLCAELCTMVSSDKLAMELVREFGRLDTSHANGAHDSGKASGIKFVAPFISDLALVRPHLMMTNISHLLPHLKGEPYYLRSSILTALGYIIEYIGKSLKPTERTEEATSFTFGDDAASPSTLAKSRSALLDILYERVHDVSSYTRSSVLKAWIKLAQTGNIPVERVLQATTMAMDRLQDKTVIVRKQSLQLLTTLLENNPYMGDLNPTPYRQKLAELYTFVKNNLPDNIKDAHDSALADAEANGEPEETLQQLEQATLAAAIAEADEMGKDGLEELDAKSSEFRSNIQALKFAQSALEFIDQFENASTNLQGMLLSANISDVTEALRFFVKARHFNLPCAVSGMKQALTLMWSTEQNIKDEVLKAFVDVFIALPGSDGESILPNKQVAINLISLTSEATASESASIEEAIRCLVQLAKIPAGVFSSLWSVVASGPDHVRSTALHVLAMAAGADGAIVDSKSRLKTIHDVALDDHMEETRDWKLVYSAALALQRAKRAEVDPSDAKYLVLERIIEQLQIIARGDWCHDNHRKDSQEWFAVAEQTIAAIFVISPSPESTCADIVRGMSNQTIGTGDIDDCHPIHLARFFHVLGHIALKLLVYTEALSSAVRRATAKKTLKKQEEADKAKRSKGSNGRKSSSSNSEEEDIEAELGMAAELEAENERQVAEIAEKEIVCRGLLSVFGPLLARVVANEGDKYSSEILRQTSTLALCKFMCVSSSFCEQHLPVIFTALANAPSEDVVLRANTVIALGDLAFRFPNEVEPYTPRLYACLRDSSTKVRRHTLMVLTHLILNDMVKVKGQVCEIALCLHDPDQRIQDTSRLLFHELSRRSNNPVYNLLPDIISQLSHAEISKDDFRGILAFLLGYIKKDRQNDMLLEKLFQRLPKCSSISQVADITYCMTQLKVNEKSIKTLSDNYKQYKDSLSDDEVKKHITTLIGKAKKNISNGKPESKQAIEELESRIEEATEIALQDKLADDNATKAKAKASKRSNRKQMRRIIEEEEEEEEDESEDDGDDESQGEEEADMDDEEEDESDLDTEEDEDMDEVDKENEASSLPPPGDDKTSATGSTTRGSRRNGRRLQSRVS